MRPIGGVLEKVQKLQNFEALSPSVHLRDAKGAEQPRFELVEQGFKIGGPRSTDCDRLLCGWQKKVLGCHPAQGEAVGVN